MSESLDRLTEMVRQAEAKSRAQRIHIEIRNASDQLRVAADRARRADQRFREVRPARLRELEEVDTQERQLKDLVRKVAQMKPSLEVAESPDDLIVTAHRDIEVRRREARAELESIVSEADEAKQALRLAMEQYQQIRQDLERLQPHLVSELSEPDRLLAEAAMYFPAGQLQSLARDVEEGVSRYGSLDSREQYAQLKVWIGGYRRLQTFPLTEDEQALSRRIFSKLVGLSKEYEPGYIEAFQINFSCDWEQFIDEAREQLKQAVESARRRREEKQVGDYKTRGSSHAALDELKSLLIRFDLPAEGADEFRVVLNRVVAEIGPSDPQVLDLVMPFRELIDQWSELRALQRSLDRNCEEEVRSADTKQNQFDDLLSVTRGMRVVLVDGPAREASRRLLERVFNFKRLDWQDAGVSSDALSLELDGWLRNQDVDLVLILDSPDRGHLTELIRTPCESAGIPCVTVEQSAGPAQIADALRRCLLRTA
jgi:hypothetical protein